MWNVIFCSLLLRQLYFYSTFQTLRHFKMLCMIKEMHEKSNVNNRIKWALKKRWNVISNMWWEQDTLFSVTSTFYWRIIPIYYNVGTYSSCQPSFPELNVTLCSRKVTTGIWEHRKHHHQGGLMRLKTENRTVNVTSYRRLKMMCLQASHWSRSQSINKPHQYFKLHF